MGIESTSVPTADGTAAYYGALALAGPNQAAATLQVVPMTMSGQISRTYKASGTLLFTETRGGIITSTSAGTTTWTVPLMYTLGNGARDPVTPKEVGWLLQRGYLGTLIVSGAQYWGEVASSGAMTALSSALVGDWCQRSDQGHQPFVLTTAPYSTSGNWTAVSFALANRPRIAWGSVANNSAMVALSNALVGDWCTKADDSGNTYQLLGTTSGPSYYATASNWFVRTDADKPVTPQVKLNFNNLDPSTLAKDHPEVWLKSNGVDSWVAS